MRRALLPVVLVACGAPQTSGTLVHRFEHADEWVAKFDDPARDDWQKPAAIVNAMTISKGMTVADIGAGTGYFEPHLAHAVEPGGAVLAVDIEPDMIRHLEARAAKEHLASVKPVLGRVHDPKLPAHAVDRILIVDTWHHIPDHAAYLAKLRDALAANGTITIVELTMDAPEGPPLAHRIKPEDAMTELRSAGFAVEKIELGLPRQYAVVAHLPL